MYSRNPKARHRREMMGSCPEVRHKRAGDEYYDICDLNGKHCLIEHGLKCEYYEEYLKEAQDE